MASSLAFFPSSLPTAVRASSSSSGPINRKKPPSASSSSSSSTASAPAWWAPLFGWSSDPDYINNSGGRNGTASVNGSGKRVSMGSESSSSDLAGSRYPLGCFTEEKARQLRRKTMEGRAFHDVMYHSAIASRLASDVSGRP